MDFHWTPQEYHDSWARIDENKSTLPGIQVAHIKSLNADSKSLQVLSSLALIPLMVGYSPKTWRKGIDSMIPKKVADLRPAKLRLILLLDARFNHNNKLIGKKMMEYGERHGLLAPEQFGSRKSLSAIEHAINKRLVLDILRQSHMNAIYVANDAKACYDRIILLVAYLTMRNFGVPALVAKSTILSILEMQHRVRTCYGDSDTYYGGDRWKLKPHGCGQGNGYGPALWACISSPLLHILRNKGYGTKLQEPITRQPIHLAAFAFVDDTDIIQTADDTEFVIHNTDDTVKKLFDVTQSAVNTWSSILQATGGQLEPSKTFCVPILHQWKGHRAVLQRDTSDDLQINLCADGRLTPIDKKDPNAPFFTLGIWQSPSGKEDAQKEHLLQKIALWDKATTSNKITWTQARIASKATIGRTLCYALPATALSHMECSELQQAYLRAFLGKIGVVRTAPATIATAPTWLGGFGLMSFEIEQFIAHVGIILQHGHHHSSITGMLLRTSFEYYAIETGLPGDPLQLPCVQYVTQNTWVGNTLQFMQRFHVTISSDISGLSSWTSNDSYIMQLFLALTTTTSTLVILNKVRLYLRVVTLSDLLSSDGNTFDINALRGHRVVGHPNPSYYRYVWPKMPPPTKAEKEVWSQYLCMALNISLGNPSRPTAHVVQWTRASRQYSKWLYSEHTDTLYQRCDTNLWITWVRADAMLSRYTTRSTDKPYTICDQIGSLPPNCIITSVHQRGLHVYRIQERLSTMEHTDINLQHPDHPQVSEPITPHALNYLYNITLHNGTIFSDGSSDNKKATYAVVAQPPHFNCPLKDVNLDSFEHFSGHVTGSIEDLHSYRAELTGIHAAIAYTNTLCKSHGVTKGTCTIYCDNKGALQASFGHKRPTPRWSSYDVVQSIRHEISTSPITWHFHHVKGHQDSLLPFPQLPYPAQGNVLADKVATMAYASTPGQVPLTRQEPWTLAIGADRIVGDLPRRMMTCIYKPIMTDRWGKIFHIPDDTKGFYDWDTFYRHLALIPSKDQRWITKYNSRLLPVGINLKRRRHSQTAACPCCGEEEDHDHLIQCTHPDMTHTFHELYEEICSLLHQQADPTVAHTVLFLLQYYRCPSNYSPEQTGEQLPTLTRHLIPNGAFFAGLWPRQWLVLQMTYHATHKIKRKAQRWIINLIRQIQNIPKAMWGVRNRILHNTEDSLTSLQKHADLNNIIDAIFKQKPHQRMMAHCDVLYFNKHNKDQLRNFKLQKKLNWIAGANLIMTRYERTTSSQSERFKSYFQWDNG
jgi:hypothetical protein